MDWCEQCKRYTYRQDVSQTNLSFFETLKAKPSQLLKQQGSHSDWKTWKNGKAFSSQGKVREFWWDWKSQGKSHKILENWGNFRQMLFVIFQWQLNEFVYYLLNLIKCSVKKTITVKNTGKWEKILEKSGKVREFCQSGKVGTLNKSWCQDFPGWLKCYCM